MKKTAFDAHILNNSEPILIVDKIGAIGERLSYEYSKDFLVVLVSKNVPEDLNKNIIYIPLKKKIPKVPYSKYLKIFLVDDGEVITRESAFSFIDLARSNNSPIYFIGSVRNIDIQHSDQVTSSYKNAKVLVIGDLFDKSIFFDKEDSVNRFIVEARQKKQINVSGEGLAISYPISFEDTVKLIIKASYLEIPQKVVLLFYKHPITDISLANTFKKINPNILVDFIKSERKERRIYLPSGGQHAIEKYNLEDKIREIEIEDSSNRELKVIQKPQKKNRGLLKSLIFLILIIVFIMLLPGLTTFAYVKMGERQLGIAWDSVEKGDLNKAYKDAQRSKQFFETAEKTSKPFLVEIEILKMQKYGEISIKNLENGKDLSTAMSLVLLGFIEITKQYESGGNDLRGGFEKASNSIEKGLILTQKVRSQNYPKGEMGGKIDHASEVLDIFSASNLILPELLGFDSEKTYLIVLQNNLELRPGGGVIMAFGVLKLKDGRVVSFEVKNSKDIDDNLKALVEPDFALRRYGGEGNLFFKDASIDPDFVKSAIKITEVFTLSSKEDLDGVIGVDLKVIRNLLPLIGSANVSNKIITKENLYEKSLEAIDNKSNDFFPNLMLSLVNNIRSKNEIYLLTLLEIIGESIKEKSTVVAFKNPDQQNIFSAIGWSSTLSDKRENDKDSINDYFGISEANLSKQPINNFISRSLSKKVVVLDTGKVTSRTNIIYKNNLKGNSSKNIYKNYLRIIVPEGSKITTISINEKDQKIIESITNPDVYEKIGFKVSAGIELEGITVLGKNIYGFFVTVNPEEIKTISILYELPFTTSNNQKNINYSLSIYKQPGMDAYPIELDFSLPNTYDLDMKNNNSLIEINSDKNLLFSFNKN